MATTSKTPILKKKIADFADFVTQIEHLNHSNKSFLYRGQPVPGNLLPSIARKDLTADTTNQEKEVLEQLKLLGASFLKDSNGSNADLDLLVLAQHFGLKTRLLDWTSNPLAALWFACADPTLDDVYVYALQIDNLLVKNVYATDPFTHPETRVFQPRLNNPRIVAQHGWFTLHRYSQKGHKFVPLDFNPKTKPYLTEFRIPQIIKINMLASLERHGIGRKTLFPDLAGLCAHLNWTHRL